MNEQNMPNTNRLDVEDLLTRTIPLPAMGRPRAPVHVFERDTILAVNTALACARPLLVRGEPGAGKSQLARAVAVAMKRVFVSKFVDARTEAHDLLWHNDAVARLAEAQAMARPQVENEKGPRQSPSEALALARFIEPRPLWWALNWKSASDHVEAQQKHLGVKATPRITDPLSDPANGVVLLIDEIDKADSSVPNGLLEVLGQGTFDVPGLDAPIEAAEPAPLVLLTTNEDRVLPDAFVRRCVVLYLGLPPVEPEPGSKEPKLVDWLIERGKAHFAKDGVPEDILGRAAELLAANRVHVHGSHRCPPGLAEYIDLITAVVDGPGKMMARLEEIAPFLLLKHVSPKSRVRR